MVVPFRNHLQHTRKLLKQPLKVETVIDIPVYARTLSLVLLPNAARSSGQHHQSSLSYKLITNNSRRLQQTLWIPLAVPSSRGYSTAIPLTDESIRETLERAQTRKLTALPASQLTHIVDYLILHSVFDPLLWNYIIQIYRPSFTVSGFSLQTSIERLTASFRHAEEQGLKFYGRSSPPIDNLLKLLPVVLNVSAASPATLVPFVAVLVNLLHPEQVPPSLCSSFVNKILELQLTADAASEAGITKRRVLEFAKTAIKGKTLHPLDVFFGFYPDSFAIQDAMRSIMYEFRSLPTRLVLLVPKFLHLARIRNRSYVEQLCALTLHNPMKVFHHPKNLVRFMRSLLEYQRAELAGPSTSLLRSYIQMFPDASRSASGVFKNNPLFLLSAVGRFLPYQTSDPSLLHESVLLDVTTDLLQQCAERIPRFSLVQCRLLLMAVAMLHVNQRRPPPSVVTEALELLHHRILRLLRGSKTTSQKHLLYMIRSSSLLWFEPRGHATWKTLMHCLRRQGFQPSPQLFMITTQTPGIAFVPYGLNVWPTVAASIHNLTRKKTTTTPNDTRSGNPTESYRVKTALDQQTNNVKTSTSPKGVNMCCKTYGVLFLLRLSQLVDECENIHFKYCGAGSPTLSKAELQRILKGYIQTTLETMAPKDIPSKLRPHLLQGLIQAALLMPSQERFRQFISTTITHDLPTYTATTFHNLFTAKSIHSSTQLVHLLIDHPTTKWSLDQMCRVIYQLLQVQSRDSGRFSSDTQCLLKRYFVETEKRVSFVVNSLIIDSSKRKIAPMAVTSTTLKQCVQRIMGDVSAVSTTQNTMPIASSQQLTSSSDGRDCLKLLTTPAELEPIYPTQSIVRSLWETIPKLDLATVFLSRALLLPHVKQNGNKKCALGRRLARLSSLCADTSRYLKIQRGGHRVQQTLPPIVGLLAIRHHAAQPENRQMALEYSNTYMWDMGLTPHHSTIPLPSFDEKVDAPTHFGPDGRFESFMKETDSQSSQA